MASAQPMIKQIAWLSVIPQLAVFAVIMTTLWLFDVQAPILVGATVYLIISISLRILIPKNHRRGIILFKKKKFAEAVEEFNKSYAFFQRHRWLDDFRYLAMLSSSRMSYREMALLNMAFCYGQLGEGRKSKEFYEQTLEEFPESEVAQASLRMFSAMEKNTS